MKICQKITIIIIHCAQLQLHCHHDHSQNDVWGRLNGGPAESSSRSGLKWDSIEVPKETAKSVSEGIPVPTFLDLFGVSFFVIVCSGRLPYLKSERTVLESFTNLEQGLATVLLLENKIICSDVLVRSWNLFCSPKLLGKIR